MRAQRFPTLKVFIASPGDVGAERRAAVKAIEYVNEHVAKPREWRIEPLMWERDVLPGGGKDAQSIINAQIGEMRNVAVFLLIMRDRFGTPTPRAGSGTEEEYDRAMAARKGRRAPQRPELFLYFGEPKPGVDAGQRKKVEAFRARAGRSALWTGFTTSGDFRRQFESNLTKWLSAELDRLAKPRLTPAKEAALNAGNTILLGNTVYRQVRQEEGKSGTVLTLALRTVAEEDALNEMKDRMRPVPYAFGLRGGAVQVSQVDFDRVGGKTTAKVRLASVQVGYGTGSFGSLDEAARKRAVHRLLLGGATKATSDGWRAVSHEESVPVVVPEVLKRGTDVAARAEAKLRAVHALLDVGLVTEVKRLDIGAPSTKGVKVVFEGVYRAPWGGSTQPLKVEGYIAPKEGRKAAPKAKRVPVKPKKS